MSLASMSVHECQELVVALKENIARKERTINILESHEEYAEAVSLQLILLEEELKLFFIELDTLGFQFRNLKGFNSFYRNHNARFVVGVALYIINDAGIALATGLSSLMNEVTTPNGENDSEIDIMDYTLPNFIIKRADEYISHVEEFKTYESKRQNGFYVDMATSIITPSQLTKEEYFEMKIKVDVTRTTALLFKDIIVNPKFPNLRDEYIGLCKKYGYSFLENHLFSISSAKKFELFDRISSLLRTLKDLANQFVNKHKDETDSDN